MPTIGLFLISRLTGSTAIHVAVWQVTVPVTRRCTRNNWRTILGDEEMCTMKHTIIYTIQITLNIDYIEMITCCRSTVPFITDLAIFPNPMSWLLLVRARGWSTSLPEMDAYRWFPWRPLDEEVICSAGLWLRLQCSLRLFPADGRALDKSHSN